MSLVSSGEVRLALHGIGGHRLRAWLPAGWAHLAVLSNVLECLHKAKSLVDVAANWQIVDGDLAQVLLGVDNEKTTEGNAFILLEHAVVRGHLLGNIGKNWDVHLAKTALLAVEVRPGQVAELAVNRRSNDLSVDGAELFDAVAELNNLGGAHKREIKWVEEQDQPFALELRQLNVAERAVGQKRSGAEIGCRLAQLGFTSGHTSEEAVVLNQKHTNTAIGK